MVDINTILGTRHSRVPKGLFRIGIINKKMKRHFSEMPLRNTKQCFCQDNF